ncbi:hypothetical protein GSI_12200 [Ganoderma sinense ZZ0214-1]|uniref:BTB domain-containing protein n=1 Tax=Ganoderma sinense ZZ0214-1 TaxID=1077348 RepID=A0A2G8RY58_9APHY|nr:hypothetical protein GSI_12200 [Ganoderma sinense ZZ0214-1]
MSQDSRPFKRARSVTDGAESSDATPHGDFKRSEEFWMPDGNIVLIAGETAFRVYRGLLALQSTVFADLFASSSPNAEESYEDCPLIRLTDSPHDLAHLLRVLLPTSRMLLQRREDDPQLSLHQISAIIRLTHKYHIEDLHGQALYVLQDAFGPRSLRKWEDDFCSALLSWDDAGPIAVVNIARLTDTPSLLPIALYECCNLGEILIDGRKGEDGTVEHLSPADLKRCVRARNEFAKEASALTSTIFNSGPSGDCTTLDLCTASLHSFLVQIMTDGSVADSAVLENWDYVVRRGARPRNNQGYCSACERELLARASRETERVWSRLPKIFDIEVPNWDS